MSGFRVTWLGHATTLIELDGVRLLTDPVLRSRVVHLRRRVPAVHPGALGPLDAILLSHGHWDHVDLPSLRGFDRSTRVVLPRGLGKLARKLGFADVVEVGVGDRMGVGAVEVEATPADHDGRRGPFGAKAPALGFVVAGSRRAYFPGDTDLFDGMSALGPLDLALIPVAGWGKKLGPGHMNAERAAEAAARLHPKVAVPIHYGTYRPLHERGDAGHPEREFKDRAAALAPDVDVRVLAPGETLPLS